MLPATYARDGARETNRTNVTRFWIEFKLSYTQFTPRVLKIEPNNVADGLSSHTHTNAAAMIMWHRTTLDAIRTRTILIPKIHMSRRTLRRR
jgi:hypothetical protein